MRPKDILQSLSGVLNRKTVGRLLDRATLNGALVGIGGKKGNARLIRTLGFLDRGLSRLPVQSRKSMADGLKATLSGALEQDEMDTLSAYGRIARSVLKSGDLARAAQNNEGIGTRALRDSYEGFRGLLSGSVPNVKTILKARGPEEGSVADLVNRAVAKSYSRLGGRRGFFDPSTESGIRAEEDALRLYNSTMHHAIESSHGGWLPDDIDNSTGLVSDSKRRAERMNHFINGNEDSALSFWGADDKKGLVQIGSAGGKYNVRFRKGSLPIELGHNVYVTGHAMPHGLFIEDPVSLGGSKNGYLMLSDFFGNNDLAKGSVMTVDMADQLTRMNPELHVAGLTTGVWYDKAGKMKMYPKALVVNTAGLPYWREFADSHTIRFGEYVAESKDGRIPDKMMELVRQHVKRDNAIKGVAEEAGAGLVKDVPASSSFAGLPARASKMKMKEYQDRLRDIEWQALHGIKANGGYMKMSNGELVPMKGQVGLDKEPIASNPRVLGYMDEIRSIQPLPSAQDDAAKARLRAWLMAGMPGELKDFKLNKRASASSSFVNAVSQALGSIRPYSSTLRHAGRAFATDPVGALKETMLRVAWEAPAQTVFQTFQNPRSLVSNDALIEGLHRANRDMSASDIANLVRRMRTSQAAAGGMTAAATALGAYGLGRLGSGEKGTGNVVADSMRKSVDSVSDGMGAAASESARTVDVKGLAGKLLDTVKEHPVAAATAAVAVPAVIGGLYGMRQRRRKKAYRKQEPGSLGVLRSKLGQL